MRNKVYESIKKHEGLRLKPYKCPAGKLTIGYGRNLEDNGITELEAEELLRNDIFRINEELMDSIGQYPSLPLFIKDVLVEMAYQMGVNGLLKFEKTLEFVSQGAYEKASIEMLDSQWAKQTPQRAKTLSNLMKGGN